MPTVTRRDAVIALAVELRSKQGDDAVILAYNVVRSSGSKFWDELGSSEQELLRRVYAAGVLDERRGR